MHVQVQFAPDLWPVEVDPGELELVILNLAVNARDAMPDGGRIRILLSNERLDATQAELQALPVGDFVRLSVGDTGSGMSDEVLARVRADTGVDLRVLSGEDEARLTFLAARRWAGWSAGRLLVVDIGGGSLELTLGDDEDPDIAKSLLLGAGRVTRDLLPGNPPSAQEIKAARRAVRATLAKEIRPYAKASSPDTVLGTSKTMRSLARIAGAAPSADGPYVDRRLRLEDVTATIARISTMTAHERVELPGVSASRAHQLLAGGIVAEAAMDLLGVRELTICPWALREGVLLRYLDLMS